MIKFITDSDNDNVTFKDIDENQFFISNQGHLCQKAAFDKGNIVAGQDGAPSAHTWSFESDSKVTPLPHVHKIGS